MDELKWHNSREVNHIKIALAGGLKQAEHLSAGDLTERYEQGIPMAEIN